MERNTILGIGCGVIFVALVGCVIFGMAVGSDDDNDVHVSGRVSISPAFTAACENAKVVITPQGLSARTIRFEAKSWRFGQGCVLPVVEDLPRADSYRIEVPGVGVETVYPDASGDVSFDISW